MLDVAIGIFVVLHGLVTAAIWLAPGGEDAPFDPAHSWLIGDSRAVALFIGAMAGVALVTAGIGLLTDAAWWPALAVVGGVVGTALVVVWFHPWLLLGLAINVGVLVAGVRALPEA